MVQKAYQTEDVSETSTPTGRGFDLPADATHGVCRLRVFLEYWSDGLPWRDITGIPTWSGLKSLQHFVGKLLIFILWK
jgi:hypothetical protein